MGQVTVRRTLAASEATLWELVRNFGDVRWIPVGDNVKIEGDGPGMVRIFPGPKGPVHERLESVNDATQTLIYTIPQGIPFPVTGYRSTMRVSAADAGAQLAWTCEFEPDGVSEADASKQVEAMYGVMIGWIEGLLSAGVDDPSPGTNG